jgi:hypothetical protein
MSERSKTTTSFIAALITMGATIATAYALWILEHHNRVQTSTFSIIGKVASTDSEKGIPFARIQLETDSPDLVEPTYADSNGNFVIQSKSALGGATGLLKVTAPGLEQTTVRVNLDQSTQPHDPLLIRLAGQNSSAMIEPKHLAVTSGPVRSGFSANWSDWYNLCLNADEGYVLQQVTFSLEGDRSCNGWAECQPVEQSPSHACWRFRMQGHRESLSSGVSIGKITGTEVRALLSHSENAKYQINIQFYGSSESQIVGLLQTELIRQGYTVPTPEELHKNFPNIVRFFRPEDREVAEKLLALVQNVSQQADRQVTPALQDFSNRYPTLPGQIEVWINLSRADISRQQQK